MNILVLGARGFIGKHLCSALVAANHRVRGFDLQPANGNWPDIPGVEWTAGNLDHVSDVMTALDKIDLVFHLISTTIPQTSNENPLLDLQQNVGATLKLLELVIKQPRKPRFIFLSSGGTIYGIPHIIPIPEEHPTDPLSAYGIAKLAIEKYLALYGYLYKLDYSILRLANPYGEFQSHLSNQGVIAAFVHKALHHKPVEIWGDGSIVRDYLYIGDVISAMITLIDYNGPEKIFNIGGGKGHSILELLSVIKELFQHDIAYCHLESRACDVPINVLDIKRAASILGWKPTTPLHEGIKRVIDYQRSVDFSLNDNPSKNR